MRRLLLILTLASPLAAETVSEDARREAYLRAEAFFESGRLWKPTGQPEDSVPFRYAPLILTEGGADHPFTPKVLFAIRQVRLGDRSYRSVEYSWKHGERPQGVRIVLGDDDYPLLWEVLHDSAGLRPVFVATELEGTAFGAHGPPLAGRSWSIEPAVETAPELVVPRTVDPGPVPMGPFVYVGREGYDVATVICRCMPSQVGEITASLDYRLAPAAADPGDAIALPLRLP